MPWPSSISPSFTETVLSALIVSHESTCVRVDGPLLANGS